MPSLLKIAVFFIPLCFVLQAEAAPLKLKLPHILPDPTEDDRDNTYGPWERNSWIGNEHPDNIHSDDLWPPLVPPRAAVHRNGPMLEETDAANSNLVTHCSNESPVSMKSPVLPQHGCHHRPLPPQIFMDSPESGSTITVHPTIQKREISTPGTSEKSATLYTGAQQWQAYWNHLAPRYVLTDEAKFEIFAQIFGIPYFVTDAVIAMSKALRRMYPVNPPKWPKWHIHHTRDTQPRGPVVAMAMCDAIGQILSQDGFPGKNSSGVLASAISTTCKSLAQLYPQHMIQAQPVTMSRKLIVTKMFEFFENATHVETLAAGHISQEVLIQFLASEDSLDEAISRHTNTTEHIESRSTTTTSGIPRVIEIHTDLYSPPPSDASSHSPGILIHGASAAHHGVIQARAFYLFQPLEQAYTWMNDIYDTVLLRHPRFPYSDPAQNINGCIYYPSPDRAAILGKVICPPGDDHK